MKFPHLLLIFITTFLLLMNCTVNKNPISSDTNPYVGTWRWIKTVGGLFPRVITPGEGLTIKINYDNSYTYRVFRNDILKMISHYKIKPIEYYYYDNKILYTNIVTYNYHFNQDAEYARIYSDTLEIWDGMIDGYFSWYIKE